MKLTMWRDVVVLNSYTKFAKKWSSSLVLCTCFEFISFGFVPRVSSPLEGDQFHVYLTAQALFDHFALPTNDRRHSSIYDYY